MRALKGADYLELHAPRLDKLLLFDPQDHLGLLILADMLARPGSGLRGTLEGDRQLLRTSGCS